MTNLFPEELNTHKKDWSNTTPVKDTHPEEHNDIAEAVEALEAKVGIDGSEDEDSIDYKLSEITEGGKAASKAALEAHEADTENPHEVTKEQVGLGNVDNTSDATKNAAEATLTNKTIDADDNLIQNLEVDNFKANVIDPDGSLSANSDSRIPTQQAVKEFVEASSGASGIDRQVFDASGTWNKPDNGTVAFVQVWGAGGSGGRGETGRGGGGGGGGAYNEGWFALSDLDATEAVTIGTGGASRTSNETDGAAGGNSQFKSLIAYGGGGGGCGGTSGVRSPGGGGGGLLGAGNTGSGSSSNGGAGGDPLGGSGATNAVAATSSTFGGGGGAGEVNAPAGSSIYGGGGGGGVNDTSLRAAGNSVYGGGGGGAGSASGAAGSGGTSMFGGAGGAGASDGSSATAGSVPGGGGGGSETGNSGAGGNGRVIVTVF